MKKENKILWVLLLLLWQNGQAAIGEPAPIYFTMNLGYQNFNFINPTGTFIVYSGVPSYEAVLVTPVPSYDFVPLGDNDYKRAKWIPYDGIVRMPLGPDDGCYQVELALKGATQNSQTPWTGTIVKLIRTPPKIFITNPTNSIVAQPYLQLQGYSLKPLKDVRYCLSNAVTDVADRPGYIINHYLDVNAREFTTDYFQCYDIQLAGGLNNITLKAADPAGNISSTNFNVTLTYAGAASPTIQLTWPQPDMEICGNSFTLRGQTEDASSLVTCSITDTNGNASTISGEVERTGTLWADNLPLHDGTNRVTLTVKNSAGLSSTTNFNVSHSSFVLTMDAVKDDLWLPKVTVTGFESDATYPVWVNGVKATVLVNADGTGKWMAHDVPVTPGGVASFDMHAYGPTEIQPDGIYGNGRVAAVADKKSDAAINYPNDIAAAKNSSVMGTPLIAIPTQPVFLKMSELTGTLYFTWGAVSNSTYQLQYTTDLTFTNWFNVAGPITASSNSVSTTDVLGKDMHRFYRVKLMQ